MPVNFREEFEKLSPAARRRIEKRAAEIRAEEMSLRDLRKARKLTQGEGDGRRCSHHRGVSGSSAGFAI